MNARVRIFIVSLPLFLFCAADPKPKFTGDQHVMIPNDAAAAKTCKDLCEGRAGVACFSFEELRSRCLREHPETTELLRRNPPRITGIGDDFVLCRKNNPDFVRRYPCWYNTVWQSDASAPAPKEIACGIVCDQPSP